MLKKHYSVLGDKEVVVGRGFQVPRKKQEEFVVLSELEHTLLSLVVQRSLYGLEFLNAIQAATDGRRELSFGSLYTTLNRMEKKGLVSWRWGDETSGPRRKYYDITPAGKGALEDYRQYLKKLDSTLVDIDAEALEEDESTKPSLVPTKDQKTPV